MMAEGEKKEAIRTEVNSESSVFDAIKIGFTLGNIEDLKELIDQAQSQIDQLNETLQKINDFKIQVS